MNTLLIYLLSRPSVFKEEVFFSLCLPGIADDGFLHFYCRFVAPELGILFAGIHKEDREDYAEKAALIGKSLAEVKLIELIEKSVKEQYSPLSRLLPASTCTFLSVEHSKNIDLVMIKNEKRGQITTLNFPAFARTKLQKHQLRIAEEAFHRSQYPQAQSTECEYIQVYDTEMCVMIKDSRRTVVLVCSNTSEVREIALVAKVVLEMAKSDKEQFFIAKYSNPV